ncbi:MAG TPA: nucleoside-diphosphate sugar epimerase/dehydratase, partial [Acidimicrobiales bacterium]|nr:nucleoside-diphosphate sugar epimerase/dehydratase [Acidimicrobiales bacterium]
ALYFRDRAPADYWRFLVPFVLLALTFHVGTNYFLGLYGRLWRHAGIEEARQILLASAASLIGLMALYPLGRAMRFERVPVNVIVIGCLFVTAAVGVLRFHSRLFAWQRGARRVGLRVAVIGSRDAGATVVRDMLHNPQAGLVPVAVFDDDVRTHGLSLLGVPVVGAIADIPATAERYQIQQVLLAIPSPSADLVERALQASEAAGVTMKVLPGVRELVGAGGNLPATARAREPRIEDLLGRGQVATDLDAVRDSLAGRRVLITGAGGSIGSEIARQVAGFGPALIVLLDHDETHLHDAVALVSGPCEQALVDICDRESVFDAFARYQPEVVFHAAAHKHVPILEAHPVQAAATNVFGTFNVVQAAAVEGTERFVCISTDKAVSPAGVMGASKRVAEQVVLTRAPAGAPYCVVRFGNVLGSRGSVIPTFARQIAGGGPVTVTDPRMNRYFMSVEEAVQLVLQASVLAGGGEVFMLDMGKPVNIMELAERMIRLSGYAVGTDIAIEVTGARPGEKLDEELHTHDEELLPTAHPAVKRLLPTSLPPEVLFEGLLELEVSTAKRDGEGVRELLFSLAARSGEKVAV